MIATLPQISQRTRRPEGGALAGLLALVRRWRRARRDRRELASLSDHMLRDIGLSRADVEREALRPFWQPVDHAALERQRRLAWRRTPLPGVR
jgi:uncharacterized protein YjiS (DUF1127 family)